MMNSQRGASLPELMVSLAILTLLATMTTSATTTAVRRSGLRAATGHIRAILDLANAEGQTKGAYRAVRFTSVGNEWYYAVYEDGNGNGVLSAEIARGVDRLVQGPRSLLPAGVVAQVGFPPTGTVDPDTNRPIAEGTRPVQFGSANLCSFSEYGTCSPGTIYLTDGATAASMIRCSGAEAQIKVSYYGLTGSRWSE